VRRATYEEAREAAVDHQRSVQERLAVLELLFLHAAEHHIAQARNCSDARDSMYHMTCAGIAIDKVRQQHELALKRAGHELRRQAIDAGQTVAMENPAIMEHVQRVAQLLNRVEDE